MTRAGSIRRFLPLLACIAAMPTAAPAATSPWSGRTLLVAVNAVDSPTCGAATNPCRSISQANANAAAGDTILVKPGLYGDIDGDGALGSTGDEKGGFFAAVEITKRVRVLSTGGAGATVIDAHGATGATVAITVSGVQFGERGAGFTVTGGRYAGIQNGGESNIVIAGNTVRGIGSSQPGSGQAMYLSVWGVIEVRDNLIVDNPSAGLVVSPQNATAYASVHDNVITGSNASEGSSGMVLAGGNPHLVYRNVVSDNTIGMVVNYGASRIFNNIVTGNRDGAQVGGLPEPMPAHGPMFAHNTFSANKNYGLYVIVGTPTAISMHENNFYGNLSGCGIASQSADVLDARNNFWGAVTGPSATDPADEACGFNGAIQTAPFATREFSAL